MIVDYSYGIITVEDFSGPEVRKYDIALDCDLKRGVETMKIGLEPEKGANPDFNPNPQEKLGWTDDDLQYFLLNIARLQLVRRGNTIDSDPYKAVIRGITNISGSKVIRPELFNFLKLEDCLLDMVDPPNSGQQLTRISYPCTDYVGDEA